MVLEDYTLKHVWGLRPSTARGIYKDSDPDQGSRRNLHNSLRTCARQLSRFSQRQKKPDPGQALRPFLRNCTVLEQIPG